MRLSQPVGSGRVRGARCEECCGRKRRGTEKQSKCPIFAVHHHVGGQDQSLFPPQPAPHVRCVAAALADPIAEPPRVSRTSSGWRACLRARAGSGRCLCRRQEPGRCDWDVAVAQAQRDRTAEMVYQIAFTLRLCVFKFLWRTKSMESKRCPFRFGHEPRGQQPRGRSSDSSPWW